MTLEQLKAEVREEFDGLYDWITPLTLREALRTRQDFLIDSTHQATVEEIIKIAEVVPNPYPKGSHQALISGFERAKQDIIKAIKK